MTRVLDGLSILIVEDQVLTGMLVSEEIKCAGGNAIGPVASVSCALKEIESKQVDLALLDAKLLDGSAETLVTHLEQRRIPYIVVSGYEKETLPVTLKGAPFVAKPVSMQLLVEAVQAVIATPKRDNRRDAEQLRKLSSTILATPLPREGS
jgi:DNA-binding NtrC family response regulator